MILEYPLEKVRNLESDKRLRVCDKASLDIATAAAVAAKENLDEYAAFLESALADVRDVAAGVIAKTEESRVHKFPDAHFSKVTGAARIANFRDAYWRLLIAIEKACAGMQT